MTSTSRQFPPKLLDIAVLACTTGVYAYFLPITSLWLDQYNSVTTLAYYGNPSGFASDPLYGRMNLHLPLHSGVYALWLLRKLSGAYEQGVFFGLITVHFLYLLSAYYYFFKISGTRPASIALALLSSLFVLCPHATSWGFGRPSTFLGRTIYLPLIPPLVYHFILLCRTSSKRTALVLFFALGLSSIVHQISSLYLGGAFLFVLLLREFRKPWLCSTALMAFALGISPYLIVYAPRLYAPTTSPDILPESIQTAITQSYYIWAARPLPLSDVILWLGHLPVAVMVVVLLPWTYSNKDSHVVWLLIFATFVGTYAPLILQDFLFSCCTIPYRFVELKRGLAFLPYLTAVLVSLAWTPGSRLPFASVFSLVLAVGALVVQPYDVYLVMSQTSALPGISICQNARSNCTCSKQIYQDIRALPANTLLLATDERSRFCGERAVYALYGDGGIAFPNGYDAYVKWHQRWSTTLAFFQNPCDETLEPVIREGVTHILSGKLLPENVRWKLTSSYAERFLYEITG